MEATEKIICPVCHGPGKQQFTGRGKPYFACDEHKISAILLGIHDSIKADVPVKECIGFIGKLFGHNYQPRYDTVPPKCVDLKCSPGSVGNFNDTLRNLTKKEYRCDVCTRCGDVIVKEVK